MTVRLLPILLAAGCSSGVRLPPLGSHPPHVQEFLDVEFPPPPAQVEEISKGIPGRSDCVWVDGYYAWQEGRWVWLPGYWAEPIGGCYYAPAVAAWSRGGEPRLYYTPPRWYREDALSRAGAAASCPSPRACVP